MEDITWVNLALSVAFIVIQGIAAVLVPYLVVRVGKWLNVKTTEQQTKQLNEIITRAIEYAEESAKTKVKGMKKAEIAEKKLEDAVTYVRKFTGLSDEEARMQIHSYLPLVRRYVENKTAELKK